MQYEFPFQDALDKLNVLLSQNQFELLVPNTAVSSQQTSDIRLVTQLRVFWYLRKPYLLGFI